MKWVKFTLGPSRSNQSRLLATAGVLACLSCTLQGQSANGVWPPSSDPKIVGPGNLPKPPQVVPPRVVKSASESAQHLELKTVGPGIFDLGGVILDRQQRTVSFPAVLNPDQGLLEYLLVTDYGKKYESLLCTAIEPYRLHMAMLLLDAKSMGTNQLSFQPAPQIHNPADETISGDPILIEVSWVVDGKHVRRPAEDLVYNQQSKSTMRAGFWVYNGSAMWHGTFLAQREGSLVSLVTDRSALANHSGPGHNDDHIWTANTNNLPATHTPVEVTLRLQNTPLNHP